MHFACGRAEAGAAEAGEPGSLAMSGNPLLSRLDRGYFPARLLLLYS